MDTEYLHIFLRNKPESGLFRKADGRGGKPNIPGRNRKSHSTKLQDQWAAIWAKAKEREEARTAVSMPTKDGVYIEFEGAPGHDLITESLEDRNAKIRLLNIHTVHQEDSSDQEVIRATVFIPSGKQNHFLRKLNQYAQEETPKGKPKNARLIESVENIRLAVLESFWRDDFLLLPKDTSAVWCEIWLQGTGDEIETSFREMAKNLGINTQKRTLRFPERSVLLGEATRLQLTELLEICPDIAEFRRAKETARFFLELDNKEQIEWVKDLHKRLAVNLDADIAICVLDTGANNGHQLLEPILSDSDCHTVEPAWGSHDHDGHGTLMCGVTAYGDLLRVLQHNHPIRVEHCLESTKILPPNDKNSPELYGDITIQGLSRAEIQAPERTHIACMAVTSEDGRDRGRPSSWSGAIDALTSGYSDDTRRLFIVSAGNNSRHDEWKRYPESNQEYSIHDPGQSWNALTVGAYTEKAILTDPDLHEHTPLAQPGELSPFSSTSLKWDRRKWPVKPDIVLEGGNLAKGPDGFISEHDDLSLLSTSHKPVRRQFTSFNATSAAAAQAAWMAAQIQVQYPDVWPETIRGLMVHSAEWPEALKKQFLGPKQNEDYPKTDYGRLLRICGYGIPNLSRALACAANSLTLISETEIQPYNKKGGNYSAKDMHVHQLPWPKDILLELGETLVTLRITLSYFIEPGPGEIGWKDKYRYPSYGLRFSLNSPGETKDDFKKRLNLAAREAKNDKPDTNSRSDRWRIGSQSRDLGSIHSDIWQGTAADIAACNLIGVYPIGGWWKDRYWLGRWDRKARYSLIVSIDAPEIANGIKVDIYTPVANKIPISI